MRLLVDMNLAPAWASLLTASGHVAWHWRDVGDPRATDAEFLRFARRDGSAVLTHDLDFGAILAAGGIDGPSVIQLRSADVRVAAAGDAALRALRDHASALERGALLTIDTIRARVRMLSLMRADSSEC